MQRARQIGDSHQLLYNQACKADMRDERSRSFARILPIRPDTAK
jgi:hypothetical protein